jgi:hypothetical protein
VLRRGNDRDVESIVTAFVVVGAHGATSENCLLSVGVTTQIGTRSR